jgi:hypothetical protein
MPRGSRSAVLAIGTGDGNSLPVLRVEWDVSDRQLRQTELTDLRSAFRPRPRPEETTADDMAAMRDAGDRPMPPMPGDTPEMSRAQAMHPRDENPAMMTGAVMGTGRGPMPPHAVNPAASDHGKPGAGGRKRENHEADRPGEDEHMPAGGESPAHAMGRSEGVVDAALSGEFTNQAGDLSVLPAVWEHEAPRHQPVGPSAEEGKAAPEHHSGATEPGRSRDWEAVAAGAAAVAAAGGAYLLERHAQRTGRGVLSWHRRTVGSLPPGRWREARGRAGFIPPCVEG